MKKISHLHYKFMMIKSFCNVEFWRCNLTVKGLFDEYICVFNLHVINRGSGMYFLYVSSVGLLRPARCHVTGVHVSLVSHTVWIHMGLWRCSQFMVHTSQRTFNKHKGQLSHPFILNLKRGNPVKPSKLIGCWTRIDPNIFRI